MYYRKYFAGTVEKANLTRTTVMINDNASYNEYYIMDDVICRAVQETLTDVGISCEYNAQNSTLIIDGLTVQLFGYRNTNYLYYNVNGLQVSMQSYHPFNGNNYKFYVTIKGDIESVLLIAVGNYNSVGDESLGFAVGKGVDLKDGEEIRTVGTISDAKNNSKFFIIKNDKILEDYKQGVVFGFQINNEPKLNGNGTETTLVKCVAQPGRFEMSKCYFGNQMMTNDCFYNIGGDIYYKLSYNMLVKCINWIGSE